MQIKPNSALPPPSEDTIADFEDAYQVRLPEAFRRFLLTSNGGTPVENTFLQGGKERMVEFFLPLLDDPEDNPEGWRDMTVVLTELDGRLIDDEDLVGMNVIPFAGLFAGDMVCFDFRLDPESPAVSVWDHERSDELVPHLEKIANSFDEFLKLLS